MDYDSSVISYPRLLEAFWSGHDTTHPQYSLQYRSAIFYTDNEQNEIAIESRQKEELSNGTPVFTDIQAFTRFYSAEEYHQKYYLQGTPDLMAEIKAIYTKPDDWINSTAAARLNGYMAGYGNAEVLRKQIDRLGLSASGQQKLSQLTARGLEPGCPVPDGEEP